MAAFTAAASASTLPMVTFSLDPQDGFLEGAAGTSVGWGYTISSTNTGSSAFVFIQSFSFGDMTPVGTFLYDDPLTVPSSAATDGFPITVPWVLNISGLQYDIAAGAVVGGSTQGVMTLTYDVYSDAEQTDPIDSGLSVNAQINAQDVNAEVFVDAPAVPEPGAGILFVLGAAGLLLRKRFAKGLLRRSAAAGRAPSS
jgi:hypothetical protein